MARNTLIQIRRGTTTQWSEADPPVVLSAGEWGYDTTTKKYKIGDGVTAWNSLPYASILPNSDNLVGTSGIGINFASTTGIPVTISVTGIQSSQVNNFNSSVSGLLPSFTGISGVNVDFNSSNNQYTIQLVDPTIQVTDITDFVDGVNDRVNGLLTAGSNVQLTYLDNNDETSSLTIAVTGVSLAGHTHVSTDITDFNEAVQDVVGTDAGSTGFLRNGSGIAWTYNDEANTLTVGVTGIPSSLVTDFGDAVGELVDTTLMEGTGIGLSYDSEENELIVSVTGIPNTLVQGLGTMSTQNSDSVSITNGSINVSGLTVNNTGVSLAGHSHVWNDVTDASSTATLSELAYLSGVVAGTVSANRVVVVDSDKDVAGVRNLTTDGDITVGGNLVVGGSSTIVNSTEVEIGDNIITVNTSGLPEGGFRVFRGGDAQDNSNYKSLIWNNTDNRWEFSGPQILTSGLLKANTLESTVAGPTAPIVVASTGLVTNLNSDLLDGQDGTYYLDYTNFSNKPTIGSGTLTLNVSGSGLSGSASFGANDTGNTTFTVTSNATPANVNGAVVARDSSGNFSATDISASQFIGGGSGLTNLNASNLTSGTVASGLLPNVDVGSTAIGPTGSFVSSVTTDAKGRVTSVNTTTHTLATTSVVGIASFDTNDFSVSSGAVSIKTSGVSNSQLVNSSLTFGITSVALGASSNRIDHLVAISGESTTDPTVLTFCRIDGGSP